MRLRDGIAWTAATLTLASAALAQGERGRAELSVGGKSLSIEYGRPRLQGRDMLAQAPPGFVWRLGADQATVIETEADLVFGDETIPAGSYSLFARRADESSWELVFNEQTGQWGTERDPERDVAAVALEWTEQEESTEVFTISLAESGGGAAVKMSWGNDVLSASFAVQ